MWFLNYSIAGFSQHIGIYSQVPETIPQKSGTYKHALKNIELQKFQHPFFRIFKAPHFFHVSRRSWTDRGGGEDPFAGLSVTRPVLL